MLDFLNSINSSTTAIIALIILSITLIIGICASAYEKSIVPATIAKVKWLIIFIKLFATMLLAPTMIEVLGGTLTMAILLFFMISIIEKLLKKNEND